MRCLVLALLAALMLPSWSAALQPASGPRDAWTAPSARFLPGSDVGVSPHATWEDKHGGGHVNLLGVAGARLVVDEALRLRAERATSRLELHAEADGLDGVGELHLTVHKGDTEVGRLTLTRTPAFLDLGSVRAGEEFGLGAVLSIPSHSTRGGRVLVRLWIEAGPDQRS